MFNFDAAFRGFGVLVLSYGQTRLWVAGDVEASEVEEYLEDNGVHCDCYQMTNGVVVAVAGADERRARRLLENWR